MEILGDVECRLAANAVVLVRVRALTSSGSTGGGHGSGDAKTIISPNTSFGDIMRLELNKIWSHYHAMPIKFSIKYLQFVCLPFAIQDIKNVCLITASQRHTMSYIMIYLGFFVLSDLQLKWLNKYRHGPGWGLTKKPLDHYECILFNKEMEPYFLTIIE